MMQRYYPDRYPPERMDDLRTWMLNQLDEVALTVNRMIETDAYDILHTAPSKPVIAQRAYADGTDWNPGSGPGFYGYEGTSTASAAWVKL